MTIFSIDIILQTGHKPWQYFRLILRLKIIRITIIQKNPYGLLVTGFFGTKEIIYGRVCHNLYPSRTVPTPFSAIDLKIAINLMKFISPKIAYY